MAATIKLLADSATLAVSVINLFHVDKSRPKSVEPIDYETFALKNKVLLINDPQRDMLNFPHDDVTSEVIPRRIRTVSSTVPKSAQKDAASLLVKECIKTYTSDWNTIQNKYSAYGGNFQQLPAAEPRGLLPEQTFEIDTEADDREEEANWAKAQNVNIAKKGWLHKGPGGYTRDNVISFTKQFKRRYFTLQQQADNTYLLQWFKDDRKNESKGAIFLDSASDVVKNTKKGRFCFEIRMQDGQPYIFAGENEADMNDWIRTLKTVIFASETSSVTSSERSKDDNTSLSDEKDGKKESMHRTQELNKYSRETETILQKARQDGRHQLFSLYPAIKRKSAIQDHTPEDDLQMLQEQLGKRFLLKFEEFKLKLQANVADEGRAEKLGNPEPFFITFALYDAKNGIKLSADFHIDPNSPEVKAMIPAEITNAPDRLHSVEGGKESAPHLDGLDENWLTSQNRQCIFTVNNPHSDIYIYAKIEKVLQGGISQCAEPYHKSSEVKVGTKVHKTMKQFCSCIGHYRMPFAWAARPLVTQFSGTVNTFTNFLIYKQETHKMSEEEILKNLTDIKRPDKQGKWQEIPASFKVSIDEVKGSTPLTSSLTSSLVPIKPFSNTKDSLPMLEMDEFMPSSIDAHPYTTYLNHLYIYPLSLKFDSQKHFTKTMLEMDEFMPSSIDAHPYTTYLNHLYIYPLSLKFDSQKHFTKARNVAVCVEIRDSDDHNAVPLKRIYGRDSVFTTVASAPVLHHNTTPEFHEEVKIALPTQLHERHHILFRFYHVSCEGSKAGTRISSGSAAKRKDNIEMQVGYAWLPLLHDGRVLVGEHSVPVSANIPSGYLPYGYHGALRSTVGPDIKWIDNFKLIFKAKMVLKSTTYAQDQHLQNFFAHCEKIQSSSNANLPSVDKDTANKLKALHAVELGEIIQFLPTILNQLLRLLPQSYSEEVSTAIVQVLIHMVSEVEDAHRGDILQSYVKYVFKTETHQTDARPPQCKTVHEELVKCLVTLLRPGPTDQAVIQRFLKHSWFFFEIIIKSMAQHLLASGLIKKPRNERCASDFQHRTLTVVQYLVPIVIQKCKEMPQETRNANNSIAQFIKACFTYMDRGFVFRMIKTYIDLFSPSDSMSLQQFKFEFLRIICSHEQYIPLCLPLMRRGIVKNYREYGSEDIKHDYTLSDEFNKNHYLVGLLLRALKDALYEVREVRRCAITVVRNQLAKHSFDDRYTSKSQQGRIASLYLPLISILLENKNRLNREPEPNRGPATPRRSIANGDTLSNLPESSRTSFAGTDSVRSLPPGGRETLVFAMIAGQSPSSSSANLPNPEAKTVDTVSQRSSTATLHAEEGVVMRHQPEGNPGTQTPQSTLILRHDKLEVPEIRDLLVSFLSIVKSIPEDILLGWFNNNSEIDILDFFNLLEICLEQFKYIGRRKIATLTIIGDSGTGRKMMSMPPRLSKPAIPSRYSDVALEDFRSHVATSSEADAMMRTLQEANMSTEVGLIILDVLSLYTKTFKDALSAKDGDNVIMRRIFQLYLMFLKTSQSETLQKHTFAVWRSFVAKFPSVLFKGNATLCGDLCYELLRCCNSRLFSTRKEACALLYLLMKTNFEFFKQTGFTRVHLQVIISVSQLIGDVVGLSNDRFQDSLAMINTYAHSDRSMKKTTLPTEVKDLTKRIRTVLMATAQMREHENDPEMLIDLQYSLAKSYASTPELRKTWLDSMARIHNRNGNFSEAAHCYLHIAALVAEYLKRRGSYPEGCAAFAQLSSNIAFDESGIKDDSGMQDVQYTEDTLVEFLELASQALNKGERYEVLGSTYKLIIPIYERHRDFKKLSETYKTLNTAYTTLVEVMASGKRLLGQYFRVAFFGQMFFEVEDGTQYIYKEPKVTSLGELCTRLEQMFTEKLGKGVVKLIKDSKKVVPSELDPKYAYIQVTFVTPYFTEEELTYRQTDFEKNNNIRNFMFETPFTKNGKSHGDVAEQYKMRSILTTENTFPYVRKRITISDHREVELSPIQVAIDEMHCKVQELTDVVNAEHPDLIKLQLKLQGAVNVTVNAGPLAYANAFLAPETASKHPANKVLLLKNIFREFVKICDEALEVNASIRAADQKEYHEAIRDSFLEMVAQLEVLFGEKLIAVEPQLSESQRNSMIVFSMNSPAVTPINSTSSA